MLKVQSCLIIMDINPFFKGIMSMFCSYFLKLFLRIVFEIKENTILMLLRKLFLLYDLSVLCVL